MVKRSLPNPFYVLLLAVSTLFVVTVLGYLVSPTVVARSPENPGALAAWLDRNGPRALGGEFVVMLLAGVLAMATDRLFTARVTRPR